MKEKLDKKEATKPESSAESLKSLSKVYENVLETQIKVLYQRMVHFIAASQLPLVHINSVLDLIKKDLLDQLKEGYFKEKK